MASKNNPIYLELGSFLDTCFKKQVNSQILTIPGLGISHLFKQYCADKKINYINTGNQILQKYNILDLDFDRSDKTLETADNYFQQAKENLKIKKVLFLKINTPNIITSEAYKNSYLSTHVYKTYYFRSWTKEELKDFQNEQGIKTSNILFTKIYQLSNGIPRFFKFFLINQNLVDSPTKEIIKNEQFLQVTKRTLDTIFKTNDETLQKMQIKITSPILKCYFQNQPKFFNIILNSNLSFSENNQLSPRKLTKSEKEILEHLLTNKTISREKISEIKWGQGSYDKFSDWAINQTISRLNSKLKFYKIEAIVKVGYQLIFK